MSYPRERADQVRLHRSLSFQASANGDGEDLGSEVDRTDFKGATGIIRSGTITDGTHTFRLQHRDGSGAWTDVPEDQLTIRGDKDDLVFVAADDDKAVYVGYLGIKNKLRWAVVGASTSTGGIYDADILLTDPLESPV